MHSEIIMEYFRNPINNFEPENYTLSYHEGNPVCGDDIIVFINIDQKQQKIQSLHFTGNPSLITTAAASFTADIIKNQDIDTVMTRNYETLQKEGFEVTPRRRRAAVITLLAVQNAILQYQNKNKKREFEDLLPN